MSTKFFNNNNENTLFKKFEGILTNIPNIYSFNALVGYFRASGYFKLRPFLENIPEIRILAGINVDEITEKYYSAGQQFIIDPQETVESFSNWLKQDVASASYDREIEEGIFQFLNDIISGKIKIKAHPEKILHAKIYIFKPEDFNQYSVGSVITGSSNFSKSGLGLTKNPTYEFNVELRDYDDVKFASEEFDKLWDEAIDILPSDVTKIKDDTYLNDTFTPFELYIKLLIEYFGRRIDYDPTNIDLLLPESYMRLTYQAEAAIEGYEKLMRYNGFFLADVVGLGKTIIASSTVTYRGKTSNVTNYVSATAPAMTAATVVVSSPTIVGASTLGSRYIIGGSTNAIATYNVVSTNGTAKINDLSFINLLNENFLTAFSVSEFIHCVCPKIHAAFYAMQYANDVNCPGRLERYRIFPQARTSCRR